MINVSKREIVILKKLLSEIKDDNASFCITSGMGGHDLSDIENQLIVDILSEYVEVE